jgi:mono/diheme cytochrome c family protein
MPSVTAKGISLPVLAITVGLFVTACSDQTKNANNSPDVKTGRWYSEQQVALGSTVYETNCISCHNPQARGTFNWKQPLEDNSYPPPPLNGSAHAWHHPLSVLLRTINDGGVSMGGKMPPFRDRLNGEEKMAVIAYFQSFWNEDIYSQWQQRSQAK